MDVTILGSDSLRWARRLRAGTAVVAAWSAMPAIIGIAIAIACVSSISQTRTSQPGGNGDAQRDFAATTLTERAAARSIRIHVGAALRVVHRPGWSLVSLHGAALRGHRGIYTATRPGRAVLTAHSGNSRWRYTIAVLPADLSGDTPK